MAGRFAAICVIIVCLAGCSQSGNSGLVNPGGVQRIDTCADLVEYLRDQDLGELKSVELWDNDYGSGLKLTTAHYEVFTTLLEPLMLHRLPGFMESAYHAYSDQLSEPIETANKFTVYLFADRPQWEDFTSGFAGEQAELFCKIKAGAYYHNGACVVYNIGRKRTFSALGHEGWHQFNSRHFEFRLPSWLDEGVAMLFEEYRAENGRIYFEPGRNDYRLDALKKTLKKGKMISLKELLATNPGEVLATDETEVVMAFYSQSYALVRFLQESDCGTLLDNYRRLLADGLNGDWPLDKVSRRIAKDRNVPRTVLWNRIVGTELFNRYISNDFGRTEREYLAFCRRIVED